LEIIDHPAGDLAIGFQGLILI